METIGRVLFSLSNLCTIFVIETFRGRKCDALVGVFFFSFLHFVLLSKKSKFRYASCSNETILFSRRERKKGEGKKIVKSPSTVGSWTGIVELHLTWGGESLENCSWHFSACIRGFLDGHTRVYNVFPLSRNR